MSTALRPMTTGEILDRTFNLYRNNFVLFAGIAVLPPAMLLVVNVIQAVMMGKAAPGARHLGAGAVAAGTIGIIIGWFAYFIGLAVAHAATIFAVSAVHLGRASSIGESYGRVKGRYGRVVWTMIQASFRAFWIPALLIFVAAIGVGAASGLLKGAGAAIIGVAMFCMIIAAAVIGIVLYLRYALAVPACVLEDIKASDAIRRSVFLSAGARGQIFVIYFLMLVITYIVMFVFLIPTSMLVAFLAKSIPFLVPVFTGFAMFLAGALAGPIITIALSLVYYDQRVRKEAFDLQLLVAALDGVPPATEASGQSAG